MTSPPEIHRLSEGLLWLSPMDSRFIGPDNKIRETAFLLSRQDLVWLEAAIEAKCTTALLAVINPGLAIPVATTLGERLAIAILDSLERVVRNNAERGMPSDENAITLGYALASLDWLVTLAVRCRPAPPINPNPEAR